MSFAEKGAVGDIDPALFIGYLHRLKATGTLKFEEGPIQRAIYFREGRVLFSSSNAPEDQLGAILVAGGKIGQEKFDSIVASLEPKQSIAAALSQGGHVSQRDIGDAARRKVEQIIGSCCAQTAGQYEFEDGVLPKGALDLKLTTEKVLVSAFEVLEPSGFLSRILKSPMAVLAQADVVPADPDLARLRDALDGVSSLADIGGKVGLPLAATEARAAVLVVLGAATVVTSQIEEMALPDTGELSSETPEMSLSEESEPVEAETIAFQQTAPEAETIAFGQGPEAGGAGFGGDATLVAPPSAGLGLDPSGDATLSMGGGAGVPAPANPSQSGAMRAGGVKRERATTQDLAAVKELLGSSTAGPPRPGSASIPSQRWEPVLSSQSRPGRDHGTLGETLGSPILKSVIAVVLLGVVAAGGWMAYTAQNRPAPGPPVVATPAPSPLPSLAQAEGGTAPAVLPSPAASSSAASPSAAAVKPVITPIPATTPAPKVAEKATPTPAPKSTPVPTPAPVVAVRATPAARPAGGGYEALKAGRLAEAAAGFESVAQSRSDEFSVQLLVACSPQTVEKAIQNDSSTELFILPATIAGKPCHRLMRGFFKTNAEATQAVASLPGYYVAEGAKPKAVLVKSVLR
ncbi:MAG TPA: hypothetical protein PLD86_02570 [Vicinamibacteria bacterium]|nr:hypothetical protein [Vicinamibacteria bacterium]